MLIWNNGTKAVLDKRIAIEEGINVFSPNNKGNVIDEVCFYSETTSEKKGMIAGLTIIIGKHNIRKRYEPI